MKKKDRLISEAIDLIREEASQLNGIDRVIVLQALEMLLPVILEREASGRPNAFSSEDVRDLYMKLTT